MSSNRPGDQTLIIRCIWRCGVCSAVCSERAITYGSCDLKLNKSACSHCLVCVRVCPAGILGEETFA